MTDEEEKIAFEQWLKDYWGDNLSPMLRSGLYFVYRSMNESNRREFLEEAKRNKE